MTYGLTDSQYYSDIADAIREKRPDLPANTTFTPSEMADAISGISSAALDAWVRPAAWPDLDSLYNGETDTLWMTIDATGSFDCPHVDIKFWTTGNVQYTVESGFVQNGVFVVSSTDTVNSGTAWEKEWPVAAGSYPVVKVTVPGCTGFELQDWTNSNGNTYQTFYQGIVEWIGDLTRVTNLARTPFFVQREKIKVHTCNNSFLAYRWQYAHNLVSLDVSDWDTSEWPIDNLSSTWESCYNLRSLDLRNWDTSNWSVVQMTNTCNRCYKLKSFDASTWNTTNWAVTRLNSTFQNCKSLKSLDISNWDVSNWAVTMADNMINSCHALEYVDFSNWDISKWVITTSGIFNNTFRYLYTLENLDLSFIDFSRLSDMNMSFEDLYSLRNFTFGSNNIGKVFISGSQLKFSGDSQLTHESLINIMNALVDGVTGKTLKVGNGNLKKLSAADMEIATNKGWTIAS